MKLPKGIVNIVIAVAVGLASALIIHRTVMIRSKVEAKPASPVVVAAAEISPGTVLRAELLQTANWPQDLIPSRSVRSPQEIEGRVVVVPLGKGEPILLGKLAPEGARGGLEALLSPDKLAFTVRVDDVSGVAGFIHPGDRVDVLANLPVPTKAQEQVSRIILQDLVVLTTGQVMEQTVDKKPQVVNTVTLEVGPAQAEVLNLASTQGKIRLALRSRRNKTAAITTGVTTTDLAARQPRQEDSGERRMSNRKVTIIRGMKVSEVTF